MTAEGGRGLVWRASWRACATRGGVPRKKEGGEGGRGREEIVRKEEQQGRVRSSSLLSPLLFDDPGSGAPQERSIRIHLQFCAIPNHRPPPPLIQTAKPNPH